jgi:hypothetical protein
MSGLILWGLAIHAHERFMDLFSCGERECDLEVYTSGSNQGSVELLWSVGCHDKDMTLRALLAWVHRRLSAILTSCEAAPSITLSNALRLIDPDELSVFAACLMAS